MYHVTLNLAETSVAKSRSSVPHGADFDSIGLQNSMWFCRHMVSAGNDSDWSWAVFSRPVWRSGPVWRLPSLWHTEDHLQSRNSSRLRDAAVWPSQQVRRCLDVYDCCCFIGAEHGLVAAGVWFSYYYYYYSRLLYSHRCG